VTTIGELVSARASLTILCRYCGRQCNWPHTRIEEAFPPTLDTEAAWKRLKCKRCQMRGDVEVKVLYPVKR
jgi:hypothetical protein